jgi:hypothetical protein
MLREQLDYRYRGFRRVPRICTSLDLPQMRPLTRLYDRATKSGIMTDDDGGNPALERVTGAGPMAACGKNRIRGVSSCGKWFLLSGNREL